MRLYHGSLVAVKKPNVFKGRTTVDFGKGFYTTTSFEQAQKWADLKRKRSGVSRAVVSEYEAPDDLLDGRYATLNFSGPTKDWLDFVVKNRKGQARKGMTLRWVLWQMTSCMLQSDCMNRES